MRRLEPDHLAEKKILAIFGLCGHTLQGLSVRVWKEGRESSLGGLSSRLRQRADFYFGEERGTLEAKGRLGMVLADFVANYKSSIPWNICAGVPRCLKPQHASAVLMSVCTRPTFGSYTHGFLVRALVLEALR